MNSKLLSIRSFEKNQSLLSLINRLIINLKLNSNNIEDSDGKRQEEVLTAKARLKQFFITVGKGLEELKSGTNILTGIDSRQRSFIRKFDEAKKKPQQYRSILFKTSPEQIVELLEAGGKEEQLIMALSDLRKLINDHVEIDLKDLVGNI